MATDIYTELFNSLQEQINKNDKDLNEQILQIKQEMRNKKNTTAFDNMENNGDLEQRVETIENAIKEIRSNANDNNDKIQFLLKRIIEKLFGEDDKNELFKDFETEFGEGVIINASKGGKRHKTRKNKKSRKSKTKKTRRRS